MSKFQLAVLIIFGLCIVGGVIAFSVYKGSGNETIDLSIWGTLEEQQWGAWYSATPFYQNPDYRITYRFVPENTFDNELVNALAEDRGPDIILTFHEKILKNQGKLYPIPYSSFTLRDFQNTFIDGAEVLKTTKGILGIPVAVDPLVLFYNKDIFSNFSLVRSPRLWEEMYGMSRSMTLSEKSTGNIVQATIPLGSFSNVLHSKEIISTMIMQAGGKVVTDTENFVRASINENFNLPYSPGNAALLFFTEFSNPAKVFYTWNRSMPDSLTSFSAGDSVMFIGFASDYKKIKDKNPNLNFDVGPLPQSKGASRPMTFGRILAFAVPKGSPKALSSFGAIFEMMNAGSALPLTKVLNLPPARKDLLSQRPEDPTLDLFYDGAIKSVAWKDTDFVGTNNIFKNMVDGVTSGRIRVEEAVNQAQEELQDLINSATLPSAPIAP